MGEFIFAYGVVEASMLPKCDDSARAFVFWGRSNVGKSSLINAIADSGKIARVAARPGKTDQLNFYKSSDGMVLFVDFPGYGYTKGVSKSRIFSCSAALDCYLTGKNNVRRIFILVDARRGLGDLDVSAVAMLEELGYDCELILTKLDKLKGVLLGDLVSELNIGLLEAGLNSSCVACVSGNSRCDFGVLELRRRIYEVY